MFIAFHNTICNMLKYTLLLCFIFHIRYGACSAHGHFSIRAQYNGLCTSYCGVNTIVGVLGNIMGTICAIGHHEGNYNHNE